MVEKNGIFEINVTLHGQHIFGSPFTAKFIGGFLTILKNNFFNILKNQLKFLMEN